MSRWLFYLAAFCLTINLVLAIAPLEYEVSYVPCSGRTCAHLVNISITIQDGISAGPQQMVMPKAIPSAYDTQPYDHFIENVVAMDRGGRKLIVTKASAGPVWLITSDSSSEFYLKTIKYTCNLKQMEISILSGGDSSKIRTGYVGIYGISVFAYIEGMEDVPIQLTAEGPNDWPIFSTLAPASPPPLGRTTATCDNYYSLTDSQIAMGPHLTVVQQNVSYAKGESWVPVYLAVYAEGPLDVDKVGELMEGAMRASLDWMDLGDAPFPFFTYFMQLIRPISPFHQYGWSLEHLQSVTLVFTADGGVQPHANITILNKHLYNLVHHTLHAWIPKRSYGEHFFPFTWQVGPVFDSIWFAEGFVQYVAAIVTRNLTVAPDLFFNCLVDRRFKATLNDAPSFIRNMDLIYLSHVASTQYSDWRIASNIFGRGAMMAAEMDLMISEKTNRSKGIREAIRWIVGWSLTHKKAFKIHQLPSFIMTATGVDVSLLYKKWLKPPLNASFPYSIIPAHRPNLCAEIY